MQKDVIDKLRREFLVNFQFFAAKCLKIRTKTEGIKPFHLNSVQIDLNNRIDDELRMKGRVRFIILKARQMGISTFVNARFFHRTSSYPGTKSMVLTHLDSATKELFEMTRRYYEHCPEEFKPKASRDNTNEISFTDIDSAMKTATAGSKNVGHGSTIQCLHWSEVSRSKNQAEMTTGVMQTVPSGDGSMIILESTANGIGEYFQETWEAAIRGESEFIPIFYPWTAMQEYRQDATGVEFSKEEREYQALHGVDDEQLAWRQTKMREFKGSPEEKLAQWSEQYPITPEEAFQFSGESFISSSDVRRARKEEDVEAVGPIIAGIDPARKGRDYTGVVIRQGRRTLKVTRLKSDNLMNIAAWCAKAIEEYKIDAMFIDTVGIGAGVYDRLLQLGYSDRIYEAIASAKADKDNTYHNKRAEMWARMAEWLSGRVSIHDYNHLESDLLLLGYEYDAHDRLKLQSKKGLARSPDLADALAMTFYVEHVRPRQEQPEEYEGIQYAPTNGGSMLNGNY
ncbi:hypothetical protein BMT54_01790 [Pasteurellaceae bacterium 15-036681]|nr:hypothetical protein BMT54_01790 [Pasteurellaceae bacterium 15-036681]